MRTETETELLTPTEVARLFRVDAKTVTRWAKEGRLPYQRSWPDHLAAIELGLPEPWPLTT